MHLKTNFVLFNTVFLECNAMDVFRRMSLLIIVHHSLCGKEQLERSAKHLPFAIVIFSFE